MPELGMSLEYGRMGISENYLLEKTALMGRAFEAMKLLEGGAIANPDENRRVGHYWLRAATMAPDDEIREAIEVTLARVKTFAKKIHKENKFRDLLVIGVGGSALGPQFASAALDLDDGNALVPHFFDNTDPEGFERVLAALDLKRALVVVISKSGSTPETRNGQLEAEAAFERAHIKFAEHAVAITQRGSLLDRQAEREGWLERFPMWDWVGGRTSITSAVGLLPMVLQGLDVDAFLEGAHLMDERTRLTEIRKNPAALMALCWYSATGGVGAKALVVLPYKDRLCLFSRFLQQLVMESLGKRLDLEGNCVNQGLTVFGNKGSTDQHSYVQQLRDGLNNFFATFIEVQKERSGANIEVEPGISSGDYLQGFCLGTAVALEENFRQSLTLVLREVTPLSVGALVALFERTVGFYATLININAYHQPGVEAGKKAAATILSLKRRVVELLRESGKALSVPELAAALREEAKADLIFRMLERLSLNPSYGIKKTLDGDDVFAAQYAYEK